MNGMAKAVHDAVVKGMPIEAIGTGLDAEQRALLAVAIPASKQVPTVDGPQEAWAVSPAAVATGA